MDREEARNCYDEPVGDDARPANGSPCPDDVSTVMLRKRARVQPVSTPQEVVAVLTVLGGRMQGKVLLLRNGDNVVGRAEEADVLIEDYSVSRRHARLRVDASGRVDLLDLGSTNGTFVDGVRVTSESLHVGVRIRVGFEAVLELGQASLAEAMQLVARDQSVPSLPRPHAAAKREPQGAAARIAGYARLLESRRRRMGERHASVAELLETMGVALQADGQTERASECLVRALEIHDSREPSAPQAIARVLGRLASCDLALDRPHVAVARLERAQRLLRGTLAPAADIGTIGLLLSQVLWRLGGAHERCVALARHARDVLAGGGTRTQLLHHGAQAWLRSLTREPLDGRES